MFQFASNSKHPLTDQIDLAFLEGIGDNITIHFSYIYELYFRVFSISHK